MQIFINHTEIKITQTCKEFALHVFVNNVNEADSYLDFDCTPEQLEALANSILAFVSNQYGLRSER